MKVVLYVLAAIGLMVMLSIAGCFGMAFFAFTLGPETPDYATKEYFQNVYGDDIRSVTQQIAVDESTSPTEFQGPLNDDLVAIFRVTEDDDGFGDAYEEVYRKHTVTKHGHSLMNGIGVAQLSVDNIDGEYLVREIEIDGVEYWMCFRMYDGD